MMLQDMPKMKYEVIRDMTARDNNVLCISELCMIAGVARSGYYKWLETAPERQMHEDNDRKDFDLILNAYQFRRYDKSGRGIYMRLIHQNPPVLMNIKKIRRLMNKFGLKCPIRRANPRRRMMKALQENFTAKNILNREFKEHGVRTILLTDITYIKRRDGEFSYLSAIMDAGSKEILAHVVSDSMQLDFVLETVQLLMINHGSELNTDTIFHSDQGAHYTAIKLRELLKNNDLTQSMSRRANCWDNAPQESLWGHMKDEIDVFACYTNDEIRKVVDNWVDYYNNERYQWDLAKLAPAEYYRYFMTGVYPLPLKPPK